MRTAVVAGAVVVASTEALGAVHAQRDGARARLLIRTSASAGPIPPGWEAHPVSLEDLVLAYMGQAAGNRSNHGSPIRVQR